MWLKQSLEKTPISYEQVSFQRVPPGSREAEPERTQHGKLQDPGGAQEMTQPENLTLVRMAYNYLLILIKKRNHLDKSDYLDANSIN